MLSRWDLEGGEVCGGDCWGDWEVGFFCCQGEEESVVEGDGDVEIEEY